MERDQIWLLIIMETSHISSCVGHNTMGLKEKKLSSLLKTTFQSTLNKVHQRDHLLIGWGHPIIISISSEIARLEIDCLPVIGASADIAERFLKRELLLRHTSFLTMWLKSWEEENSITPVSKAGLKRVSNIPCPSQTSDQTGLLPKTDQNVDKTTCWKEGCNKGFFVSWFSCVNLKETWLPPL